MSDKLIDLHIHSNYSDGDLTPIEIVNLAIKNNVGIISITDHDTLLGNIDIFNRNIKGIEIIPGIELSAKTDKGRMHILGYNIDIYNKKLNEKMIELRNNSVYSVISLIYQIKKDYSIKFSTEDLQELINAKRNIGRPDIAKLCIKYGYSQTVQEAFDKYLKFAYEKNKVTNKGLIYQECIKLIKKAGGIPVLAHPKTLLKNYVELYSLLKEMKENGLMGIEVYHSDHTQEEIKSYLELSKKFNLLHSGGSDFHGISVKPDIEIGKGKNNNLLIKRLSIL